MSLYKIKFCTSPESTAMGSLSLFAVDSSSDISQYIDYIIANSMWWHYSSNDLSWYDFNDICDKFGLSTLNALDISATYNDQIKRHLNVEGNGQTLVNSAGGGPKQFCNFKTNVYGGTWIFSVQPYNSGTMTSSDYYTESLANVQACNFGFKYNEGGGTYGGMYVDSEWWHYFGFIPVFVHAAGAYNQFDTSSVYFIALILQRDDTNHLILHTATVKKTAVSSSIAIPYRENSRCPVAGGGTTTGNYQYLCSFVQSYVKVGGGGDTHGSDIPLNPSNPSASAYPAQGYDSDGNPIDLFRPGVVGGIGGDGNFQEWTDKQGNVPNPNLPTYLGGSDSTPDITTTGIVNIYELTSAQLSTLASELWEDDFLGSFGNKNINPIECVLSLYACKIPVNIQGSGRVVIGRYNSQIQNAVTCNQYHKIILPVHHIDRYWGSWLDQNPHTHLMLHLPYIGLIEINPDYYMDRDLKIEYNFDFLASLCVVHLYADDILIESKQGTFGEQIPITSSRRENIAGHIAQFIAGTGLALAGVIATATGGGAPAGVPAIGEGTALAATAAAQLATSIVAVGSGTSQAISAVNALNKRSFSIASQIQAQAAFMDRNHVYLFRVLDGAQLPANYSDLAGVPAFVTTIVQNLKGFSIVRSLRLDTVSATMEEKTELMSILQSGVFFPE